MLTTCKHVLIPHIHVLLILHSTLVYTTPSQDFRCLTAVHWKLIVKNKSLLGGGVIAKMELRL